MKRIGKQMSYMASHVIDGDSILSLVTRCYRTRRGYVSTQHGYSAVHRAIRAGLIGVNYYGGRYYLHHLRGR